MKYVLVAKVEVFDYDTTDCCDYISKEAVELIYEMGVKHERRKKGRFACAGESYGTVGIVILVVWSAAVGLTWWHGE